MSTPHEVARDPAGSYADFAADHCTWCGSPDHNEHYCSEGETSAASLLRYAKLWAMLAVVRRHQGEVALARAARTKAHLHFVRALYASPTYTNGGAS